MKILELHLDRYGPFTDKRLDFAAGSAGLHIIYGPNEAGKSTALRAILGFLFGIDARTQDNHRHPNSALRVGMRLRLAGGRELLLYRRKGNRDTLLDADGRSLSERILQDALGGLDKARFSALFGFDHPRLVEGGANLLKGSGDIGQSLFEASMGTPALQALLRGLEDEMAALYKPAASKPLLNKALHAYNEAKRQTAAQSVSGQQWKKLDKALREAEKREQTVSAELRARQARIQRLRRVQRVAPLVSELLELRRQVMEMDEVMLLPTATVEARRGIMQERADAQHLLERSQRHLEDLQRQIAQVRVPAALLAAKPRIEQAYQYLARYEEAKLKLPKLSAELEAKTRFLAQQTQRLDPARPLSDLRLSAHQLAQIRRLSGECPGLQARLDDLRQQWQGIECELKQHYAALASVPPVQDTRVLQAAHDAALAAGDLETQLQEEQSAYAALQAEVGGLAQRLGLAAAGLEAPASVPVPSLATIQRFEQAFEQLEQRVRAGESRVRDLRQQRSDIAQQLRALTLAGVVPTEEELEAARRCRDAGWEILRRAWIAQEPIPAAVVRDYAGDRPPHEVFEQDMQRADSLADRLRREAARVAEQASLLAQDERLGRDLGDLEQDLAARGQETQALQQAWEAAWAPAGVAPLSPREMREWHGRYTQLLAHVQSLHRSRGALQMRRDRVIQQQTALVEALQSVGVTGVMLEGGLRGLVQQAGACLRHLQQQTAEEAQRRRDIEGLERQQASLRVKMETAQAALDAWSANWAAAVAPLRLDHAVLPDDVQPVLDALQELNAQSEAIERIRAELETCEAVVDPFAAQVRHLCQDLAPDRLDQASDQVVSALKQQLDAAQQEAERARVLTSQLERAQADLADAAAARERQEALLEELIQQARCRDLAELEALEAQSARKRQFLEKQESLERELYRHGEGLGLDALIEEVRAVALPELAAELERLQNEAEALEAERRTCNQSIGELRRDLAQMDGSTLAAVAAEETASALAEVRQHTERYLRVRLAAMLLRQAVERYREANQGPLLRRAGELFQILTCAAYTTLKSDYDERDQPILLGVREDGASVPVEGMSDGTRDQLYLALRLSSVEQSLEGRSPLPLVMDDILINFDDRRTQTTLGALGELSRKTQILYFTHHARIAEQAQAALPASAVGIHHLMD